MRLQAALATLMLSSQPIEAGSNRAGEFDYYILALSWSPTWCALTGDARDADQCDARHDFSFTLHGLWPQHEIGWPSNCQSNEGPPSRAETAAMADIMGSGGLAWHEWNTHGRCTGLSAEDYFALSRKAYASITIPKVLAQLDRDVTLPPSVVEDAFVEANPGLTRPMITITCEGGRIDEARICLSRDLTPRTCGLDAARDCRLPNALMEKVR
jgi:ribonuclease T2